jgi:flagellar basal-body rod modification protein FlgD
MTSSTSAISGLSPATASTLASNPLISSASNTSNTSSSTSASATSGQALLDYNFNEFLTLFTTQLQNQDPTNPMDTTQMTNQLAMFSQVEQQAQTNSTLDKILAAMPGSNLTSATGYMGHTVEANGDQVVLSGGSATISYNMPSTASSTTLTVTDSSGNTVTTLSGSGASGNQSVTWNGTNSAGSTVPDGVYTVKATANTGSGAAVTPTVYTSGKVTGIETGSNGNVLDLGQGVKVNASDVVAITS